MSPEEFDSAIYDLVNFLAYTAEPMVGDRQRIGIYVSAVYLPVLSCLPGYSIANTGKTFTDQRSNRLIAGAVPVCAVLIGKVN